jgi:hypothetical protein
MFTLVTLIALALVAPFFDIALHYDQWRLETDCENIPNLMW